MSSAQFYVAFTDDTASIVGWGRTAREADAMARRTIDNAWAPVRTAPATKKLFDMLCAAPADPATVKNYDKADGQYCLPTEA